MNIGILYEGRYDKDPIVSLIKLILEEIHCSAPSVFVTSEAGGSILQKMASAAVLFFENDVKKCDIALYISDTDYNDRKKRIISQWINNYCRLNPLGNIIAGYPEPYLEQWFLNDPDSIRKTFSLPNNAALPFAETVNPKERFIEIIESLNDDKSKARNDLYSEVASNVNLSSLSSVDPSFKAFHRHTKQALRRLCGAHTH